MKKNKHIIRDIALTIAIISISVLIDIYTKGSQYSIEYLSHKIYALYPHTLGIWIAYFSVLLFKKKIRKKLGDNYIDQWSFERMILCTMIMLSILITLTDS